MSFWKKEGKSNAFEAKHLINNELNKNQQGLVCQNVTIRCSIMY